MSDRTENLYSLLEKSIKTKKYTRYKKGDLAEGVVEKVGDGYLIVKIDDVFDAVVPSGELIKDPAAKALNVGDKLKVFVLRSEDDFGNMIVSQRRTTAGQRWDMLEEAHKNDESVLVTIVEANNGGVIANIDGVVGFIPTSQLDPNRVYKAEGEGSSKDEMQKELSRRLAELIGTKITAKIMEIDKEKNKVIFSEKLALSEQPSELRSQTIKNAKIGDTMEAVATAVTTYGIFVNAEGLDGLVHVSEISWDKVENPADFAKVGDKIKVKLIDISDDGKRVAYSIKQLSEDPWNEVSLDYKVGGKVKGIITEIEDYGVIVKIDEGVTGLIHKSELSEQIIGDPKDVVTVGQEVEAVVLTISPSERKMGLSIKRLTAKPSAGPRGKAGVKKTKKPKAAGSLDIAGALEKAGITSLHEAEEGESEESAAETVEETTEEAPKPKAKAKKPAVKKVAAKAKKEAE